MSAGPVDGHTVTILLMVISSLLGIVVWTLKNQLREQKEFNLKLSSDLSQRVTESLCRERSERCAVRDSFPVLREEFKKHSHTSLPTDSRVIYRE